MFTNEQKLRLVQLFALIAQELKQVLEQVFKWNRIVSLVVVAEIVYLNAAKIENLTHAILLSEVFKEFLVVYFPAQALFAPIKQIRCVHECKRLHIKILPKIL